MLALSPMLVGGVEEEDSAFDASPTVMTLWIESDEEARVSSTRSKGKVEALMLSAKAENMRPLVRVSRAIKYWRCVVDCAERKEREGEMGWVTGSSGKLTCETHCHCLCQCLRSRSTRSTEEVQN